MKAKSARHKVATSGVLVLTVALVVIALIVGDSTGTKSESDSHGSAHRVPDYAGIVGMRVREATPVPQSRLSMARVRSASRQRQILSPAKIPPVSAECSERLTLAADGTAKPITCAHRGVNIRAWRWYAKIGNEITELGRDAKPSDVHTTACDDTSNGVTGPEEEDLYVMAAVYYGWHFSYNPTADLQSCPGQQ
jgi:hypothetical protein